MSSVLSCAVSGNSSAGQSGLAPRGPIYLEPRDVPPVFLRAFPHYKGRTFAAEAREEVVFDSNYWSGGTRYTYRGIDLTTGEVFQPESDEYGNPFINPNIPTVKLEPGKAIVCHKVFCGKDMGLTIYVHPDNLTKLLPAPAELSADERTVLEYTASLKASYGGVSNYRYHEAHRRTGITLDRWNFAKQALIGRRLLNKRGAITPAGRNARQR